MAESSTTDPLTTLGLPRGASEPEIRARYLALVKQFPPEHAPDRFREIRAAFEAACDPLLVAHRLLEPPGDDVPSWDAAIQKQKKSLPTVTLPFLLSLGNQSH